jgi:hypothetical protein
MRMDLEDMFKLLGMDLGRALGRPIFGAKVCVDLPDWKNEPEIPP